LENLMMTNAELTEMEWLAATLHATAERLQRATALLRAAGDLERLQVRVAAIGAPPSPSAIARPASPVGAAVGRAPAIAPVRELDSPATAVGASRSVAVFDHGAESVKKLVRNNAGGSRPPF
jgi:hypothetical protein